MSRREVTPAEKRMRGKIIHIMCTAGGYTLPDGKADYDRINNYIKNIGSRNPRKVILNFLYHKELEQVLTQIEQIFTKQ